VEIEEKYKEETEMYELKKRKKVLKELRNFRKPLDREELEEHARRYEDEKEKLMEQKQYERE
jgi:hypothetical protein